MDNQDILHPLSLQSLPRISSTPAAISEMLDEERIITSFEAPNTVKYISVLTLFVMMMIFGILFLNGNIIFPESLSERIMISAGVLAAFGAAFSIIMLFFQPMICVITPTRLFRLVRGSVEVTSFEEILPQKILYGKFYILLPLKPTRYNDSPHMSNRGKILLLRVPMSYQVGRYIADQVKQIEKEMDQ